MKERIIAERDDVVKHLQEQLAEQSKLMENMQQSLGGEGEDAAGKEEARVRNLVISTASHNNLHKQNTQEK